MIKAKIKDNKELAKQIAETKYGWKDKPFKLEKDDVWRAVIIALCLVATYYFTDFSWKPLEMSVKSWPPLIIIGAIMLEMFYYFIAVRGKIASADGLEVAGYKIFAGFIAFINMMLYPLYLILIPTIGFVYLNKVWTNKRRYENYCKKKQ